MNIFNFRVTLGGLEVSLASIGPSTLILSLSSIPVPLGMVRTIETDWGDGDSIVLNRRLITLPLSATGNYPFQADLGDPRNIIISHDYYPRTTPYEIYVHTTYTTSVSSQLTQHLSLVVTPGNLINNGTNFGFAREIHLVNNRIWDSDNKTMFVLETIDPLSAYVMIASSAPPLPTVPPPTTPPPTTPGPPAS